MLQEILEAIKTLRGSTYKTISVTKAIESLGSAEGAGDVLSETDTAGAGTPWTFGSAARVAGGSGNIVKVLVHTEVEAITPRLVLQVYTRYPTCEMDDNAPAASPNPADELFFEGEILLPAMNARGDGSYAVATPSTVGYLPLAFTCEPGYKDLYVVVITADAVAFTATERLTVKLVIEQL